jgi:hypothetical protein
MSNPQLNLTSHEPRFILYWDEGRGKLIQRRSLGYHSRKPISYVHEGRIIHKDWSKYDRESVVFKPKGSSIEFLYKKTDRAYRKTNNLSSILKRRPNSTKNLPYYLAINMDYWLGRRRRKVKNVEKSLMIDDLIYIHNYNFYKEGI